MATMKPETRETFILVMLLLATAMALASTASHFWFSIRSKHYWVLVERAFKSHAFFEDLGLEERPLSMQNHSSFLTMNIGLWSTCEYWMHSKNPSGVYLITRQCVDTGRKLFSDESSVDQNYWLSWTKILLLASTVLQLSLLMKWYRGEKFVNQVKYLATVAVLSISGAIIYCMNIGVAVSKYLDKDKTHFFNKLFTVDDVTAGCEWSFYLFALSGFFCLLAATSGIQGRLTAVGNTLVVATITTTSGQMPMSLTSVVANKPAPAYTSILPQEAPPAYTPVAGPITSPSSPPLPTPNDNTNAVVA